MDKGTHRKPIHQVLLNRGVSYSSQVPLVLYCERISQFLCWMNAETLEVIDVHTIASKKQGTFIKSIAYENLDAKSEAT